MDAIAKSLQGNCVLQMAFKDRLQVGANADVTIFDPKTGPDNSNTNQGALPVTAFPK